MFRSVSRLSAPAQPLYDVVASFPSGYPLCERRGFHGLYGFVNEVVATVAVDDAAVRIFRAGGLLDGSALAGQGGLEDEVAVTQHLFLLHRFDLPAGSFLCVAGVLSQYTESCRCKCAEEYGTHNGCEKVFSVHAVIVAGYDVKDKQFFADNGRYGANFMSLGPGGASGRLFAYICHANNAI